MFDMVVSLCVLCFDKNNFLLNCINWLFIDTNFLQNQIFYAIFVLTTDCSSLNKSADLWPF